MKISLLQRKRNQLAGYCKLVIYGVLDLTAATDVFKHYSKVEMDRGLYGIVNSQISEFKVSQISELCHSLVKLIGLGIQEMVSNRTN